MSKKEIEEKNSEKRLNVGIDSFVSQLMIKIYDEHIIRYYGTAAENDTVKSYVQQLFSLIKQKQDVVNKYNELSKGKLSSEEKNSLVEKKEVELVPIEEKFASVQLEKASYTGRICSEGKYYEKFFRNIEECDDSEYEIYAILHDKDVEWEDFFTSKKDVQHIHIGFRCLGTEGKVKPRRKRVAVSFILDLLHIKFDPELDESILDHDAIAIVQHWANYVYYLTHEDEKSMVDGKFMYDRDEIVRNCSKARYEATIRGIDSLRKTKIDTVDISSVRTEFVKMASEGHSLDDIIDVFFPREETRNYIKTNKTSSVMVNEMYKEGANNWISSFPSMVCRNIYIKGKPSIGKTYSIKRVLKDIGVPDGEIFIPRGQDGTTFVGLTSAHKWGIFDDTEVSQIIKVGDDSPCFVRCLYGYTLCALQYNIVISNQSFEKYFGYYKDKQPDKYDAVLSRFCIAEFRDDGTYSVKKYMSRGSRSDRIFEDKKWCNDILKRMSEYISSYSERDNYDSVIADADNAEEAKDLLRFNSAFDVPFMENERTVLMDVLGRVRYDAYKAFIRGMRSYYSWIEYIREEWNVPVPDASYYDYIISTKLQF